MKPRSKELARAFAYSHSFTKDAKQSFKYRQTLKQLSKLCGYETTVNGMVRFDRLAFTVPYGAVIFIAAQPKPRLRDGKNRSERTGTANLTGLCALLLLFLEPDR